MVTLMTGTGARLDARSSAGSSKRPTPTTALLQSAETESLLATKNATMITPTMAMDAVVAVLRLSRDGIVPDPLAGCLFAQRCAETVS